MMIAEFLKPYKYIIFDLDGVITSEEMYWNCAALSTYEILSGRLWNKDRRDVFLSGKEFFDFKCAENRVYEIRDLIFCKKKTISKIKQNGINSNWDLGYYTLLACIICGARGSDTLSKNDCKEFYDSVYNFIANIETSDSVSFFYELENRVQQIIPMEEGFYRRCGTLWNYFFDLFQTWYFGNEALNRKGFICKEEPLLPLDKLRNLLIELDKNGKILSTATGRLITEILPLKNWGIYNCFDNVVTYTDCIIAEKALNNSIHLSKPHPYQLLKALFANTYTDKQLINGEYNKDIMSQVLFVGDSMSDLIATKSLYRASFMGVLTGVLSKEDFENNKADFICNNILDMCVWN